jgi:nitronate monooxygenase
MNFVSRPTKKGKLALLKTRITEKFGLKYPIMSAPMSLHSGGQLAGAVTQAGGLGLFGATNPAGGDWLRNQIELARTKSDGRPFGLGFITHLIPAFPELFEVAIDARVPVIAFSFSDPSQWVSRAKDAGATVICQVQSIEGAAQAVTAGADLLVVQGNEAGGHTGTSNLMPLLVRVSRDYPDLPVLAAGGIAGGRGLAAVLAAGADGVWLGTAMIATPDCIEVSDSYKKKIIEARSEQTTYTKVFDILDELAYGIPPWPDGIAARVIANDLEKKWHGKEDSLRADAQEVLPLYQQAQAQKDITKIALFAGESVDFVNEIRSVSDVIEGLCREAEQILVGKG